VPNSGSTALSADVGNIRSKKFCTPSIFIYALPSDYEGFSYAAIDALAAGLPIVTTNVGGAKEAVLNGVNGYTVPTRDVASFVAALWRLIEDSNLRGFMGLASSLRFRYFTLDRMLDRLVQLYSSFTDRNRLACQ